MNSNGGTEEGRVELHQLSWPFLRKEAHTLFSVWGGRPELEWARTAWQLLQEAGLTSWSTDVEEMAVRMRFLALSIFYRSFCLAAWEERVDDALAFLFHELEWSNPTLVALYQAKGGESPPKAYVGDRVSEYEFAEEAIEELVAEEYPRVFSALEDGFGGAEDLFVSLVLSRAPEYSGLRSPPDAIHAEVLMMSGAGGGWIWLQQAAPRLI